MSWTLTKKFDTLASPGEIKRREVVSPEEIKSKEVELGLKVGLLLPQLFVSVTLFCTAVETATAWYTSCCAMVSRHRLNILLFWWRSMTFLVFWVGACTQAFTLSPPPPPPPCP